MRIWDNSSEALSYVPACLWSLIMATYWWRDEMVCRPSFIYSPLVVLGGSCCVSPHPTMSCVHSHVGEEIEKHGKAEYTIQECLPSYFCFCGPFSPSCFYCSAINEEDYPFHEEYWRWFTWWDCLVNPIFMVWKALPTPVLAKVCLTSPRSGDAEFSPGADCHRKTKDNGFH